MQRAERACLAVSLCMTLCARLFGSDARLLTACSCPLSGISSAVPACCGFLYITCRGRVQQVQQWHRRGSRIAVPARTVVYKQYSGNGAEHTEYRSARTGLFNSSQDSTADSKREHTHTLHTPSLPGRETRQAGACEAAQNAHSEHTIGLGQTARHARSTPKQRWGRQPRQ